MTLLQEDIKEVVNLLKNISNTYYFEKPKISVIVPAYNSEKFISKCLLSLINQTEKEIEIIVINDGSNDNTKDIISIFAEHDSRIILINQDHKLQGAARNNGIKHAKGEYIGFVDSDDWVDLDYFEKLYVTAKKYNSDLTLATNVRTGNGKTKKRLNIIKEEFITDLQGKMDVCHQWKDGCPTNKIYKAEFLQKFDIKFPEGIYCEDKLFTTKALYHANGIATVPGIYYYYYRNPHSTVNYKIKSKERKKDKNNARLEVLKFLKENNAQLRDGDFCAITKRVDLFGIPIYKKKESLRSAKHYILSIIKIKEDKF